MITIKKLTSLKKKTALRKTVSLLLEFELDLAAGKTVDTRYIAALVNRLIIPADPAFEDAGSEALSVLSEAPQRSDRLRRVCNDLRHLLSFYLGIPVADWDLLPRDVNQGTRRVLPIRVFLEDLRSPFNVGSVFRSAESFCVDRIILSPACPRPDHPRAERSAMGSSHIVPWSVGGLDMLDPGTLFALETGGTPIDEFVFPRDGTVILGNEELGISPEAFALARNGAGIVSIPLFGVKGSLNVTAAFAILVHTWCSRIRDGE